MKCLSRKNLVKLVIKEFRWLIFFILLIVLTSCAIPCPKEDIVVPVRMQNGRNAIIFLKKGDLDNPDKYIPYKKFMDEV